MNVTILLYFKTLILLAIFNLSLSGQTHATSFHFNIINDEPLTASFDLVKGIILVKAEIDGEVSNFILDTGSPMMILNEDNKNPVECYANSLNGVLQGEWKRIHAFSWAGVHKFNMKALSMDFSHLEYLTKKPIKGLIGYDFFGDFDLMLDFQNQLATLVPTNYVTRIEKWQLKAEIKFELEGHIPVIDAKIGEVQLRLGLDTGAGTNLLDINRWEEIATEFLSPISNASVIGLGTDTKSIVAADILETTIANSNYWNMRYVFSNLSNLRNLKENNVDGLLGFPFFKAGKFTINYRSKVLSFWE